MLKIKEWLQFKKIDAQFEITIEDRGVILAVRRIKDGNSFVIGENKLIFQTKMFIINKNLGLNAKLYLRKTNVISS